MCRGIFCHNPRSRAIDVIEAQSQGWLPDAGRYTLTQGLETGNVRLDVGLSAAASMVSVVHR